ncbi:bromoperoxidase [Maliponia aquimaris]|uniref:Uncharacterized protein n=1 Tax=Maliponia aquimaris TaxID=1673631 RepID=A0A238KDW0_9RHOB|nr:bromoperoxidase [Maliponia aquimaris]SMX41011.1 hypothetical protein MAA8898_02331 [Maliponia aquimaris]
MTGTPSARIFNVIEGNGSGPSLRDRITLPPAPRLTPAELAADMAELFALGLLQDQRPETLVDPHSWVRVDGATRFTMHELLCELRTLSWFDGRAPRPGTGAADSSPAGQGEADHRRALRLNGDGQLTLRSLLRGGVALRNGGPVISAFWKNDIEIYAGHGPAGDAPAETAALSDWLVWCGRHSRAGLQRPGEHPQAPRRVTLGARAEALHRTAPARPFHNAALAVLARGAGMDGGLPADGAWTGPRLLALMAEAESLSLRFARLQTVRPDRLPRPAVTAARMTGWRLREDHRPAPQGADYGEAIEELASAAPNLLTWVSRANRALRGPQRCDGGLFLPLAGPSRQHLNPSDLAAHVIVAGALATLIKAVFDTSRQAQVRMVGDRGPALALEDQIDRMAANISVLRCVAGGYFPSENVQDLRLGQAIALHLLRDRMERDNRSATLSFRDFDGQSVQILSHPRPLGRGHAGLRRDGLPSDWPQEAGHPAAHLTAVS